MTSMMQNQVEKNIADEKTWVLYVCLGLGIGTGNPKLSSAAVQICFAYTKFFQVPVNSFNFNRNPRAKPGTTKEGFISAQRPVSSVA